jgi:hypothetical protein
VCCTFSAFVVHIQVTSTNSLPSSPNIFLSSLWKLWKTGALGRMASPEEAAAAAAASPTVVLSRSNLQEGVVIQELSSPPLQGWKKKVCFLTNPKFVFVPSYLQINISLLASKAARNSLQTCLAPGNYGFLLLVSN